MIDVQPSKIENHPTLRNFISNIASGNHSKCKQQSKEHQTTFLCILKFVGLCTIFNCVEKNRVYPTHSSCFYVIIRKRKTEGRNSPPHPHYWESPRMTELQWGKQCWKSSWLENPRPVLALQLVIKFSILLLNTVPCRRRLSKQNKVSLLACPAYAAVFQRQGCHTSHAGACKTKPAFFRQTQ